jgi:uncharacterized protein (TIGR03067 family)
MRPFLLSFVLLTVGFAPAPLPRPERRPPADSWAEMRGNWQLIRVTGDRMVHHYDHGDDCAYALTVNTSVRPARYALRGVGVQVQGREYSGIWHVEGDTLTLCYNEGRDRYPTAFEGPGKGEHLDVHKRKPR